MQPVNGNNSFALSYAPGPAKETAPITTELGVQDKLKFIFDNAKLALEHARKFTPLKSTNKNYGDDEECIPQGKLDRYSKIACDKRAASLVALRDELRKTIILWKEDKTKSYFKCLAETIRNYENAPGNCMEQTFLAYDYLHDILKEKGIPLDIVRLAEPSNHAIVVINQPRNPDRSYPDNFFTWSKEAYIVDPWAKIACPAREYKEKWFAKMRTWSEKGIEVHGHSPLQLDWLLSINNCKKVSAIDVSLEK